MVRSILIVLTIVRASKAFPHIVLTFFPLVPFVLHSLHSFFLLFESSKRTRRVRLSSNGQEVEGHAADRGDAGRKAQKGLRNNSKTNPIEWRKEKQQRQQGTVKHKRTRSALNNGEKMRQNGKNNEEATSKQSKRDRKRARNTRRLCVPCGLCPPSLPFSLPPVFRSTCVSS